MTCILLDGPIVSGSFFSSRTTDDIICTSIHVAAFACSTIFQQSDLTMESIVKILDKNLAYRLLASTIYSIYLTQDDAIWFQKGEQ